jgi:hypothetical protein
VDPDRAAERAEDDVLAAVVDAGDRVADDLRGGHLQQLELVELEPDDVLLMRARNRRVGAHAVRREDRHRTSSDDRQRRLLARRGHIHGPRVQDLRARVDRVDAAAERRRERGLLRSRPPHARLLDAFVGRDDPGDDACESRGLVVGHDEPCDVLSAGRRATRPEQCEVGRRVRGRDGGDPRRGRRARADEDKCIARDLRKRAALVDGARDRRRDEVADEPDPQAGGRRRRVRDGRRRSVSRRAAPGSEQHERKDNETGRAQGPPRLTPAPYDVYLTADGMPLILPSFSSLYCAATALRIDAGTFGLHLP